MTTVVLFNHKLRFTCQLTAKQSTTEFDFFHCKCLSSNVFFIYNSTISSKLAVVQYPRFKLVHSFSPDTSNHLPWRWTSTLLLIFTLNKAIWVEIFFPFFRKMEFTCRYEQSWWFVWTIFYRYITNSSKKSAACSLHSSIISKGQDILQIRQRKALPVVCILQ